MVGIHISPTMRQPFRFSQLETTGEGSSSKSRAGGLIDDSDADDALHAPANADLGTIRVEVERVRLVRIRNSSPRDFAHAFHSVGPVHERSKKLGAHCVTCE